MLGVIIIHAWKIGIALNGDYSFFLMAVTVFICASILTWTSYKN